MTVLIMTVLSAFRAEVVRQLEYDDGPPPAWRKSSRSTTGNCVEVAAAPGGGVWVRDSKRRAGPVLDVAPEVWARFVADVKAGRAGAMCAHMPPCGFEGA